MTTAGLAAINAASAGDAFTVTAPAPAAVGAELTPEKVETYRAVVFLNTGQASPLNDTQKAPSRRTTEGRRFRRHRLRDRDRPVVAVHDRRARHALFGPHRVPGRDGQGHRPRPRREQESAAYWDRNEHYYNFATNVRGESHVLASVVEDPFGKQPQGKELNGIEGGTMGADHPISWCKDFRPGARSTRASATPPRRSTRAQQAPQGRDRVGRRAERSGLQRLRRHRADELPADEDRRPAERG